MPLRRKLLAYLALPALLLAMVGISGFVSLRHLEQAAGKILANNYRSIQEVRTMERAISTLELSLLVEGTSHVGDGTGPRDELLRHFEGSLTFCEGNITEEDERPLLARIRRDWDTFRRHLAGDFDLKEGTGEALLRLFQTLRSDTRELVLVNEQAMFEMETRTRQTARLMKAGVVGSLVAALLALIAFAFVAAGRISRPILEVADKLHEAVKTAPEPPVDEAPSDEIQRPRSEMGEMRKRLAQFQDEQLRKLENAQSRLALVMNRVLEGMILVDQDLHVLAVNAIAGRLLRLDSEDDALGRSLSKLSPPDDVASILEMLDGGEFQAERDLGEIRSATEDGVRVYRPRVMTVSKGTHRVEGYLLIFWDVTEEKRFEESRHRFISMLSHQLKTPMTSLSMSVNLLKEKLTDLPPRRAELLDMAIKDCQSLAALITELVDAAKGASPDFSLCKRPVELNRLLQSALKPLQAQAARSRIQLNHNPGPTACNVLVDPVKFPWVVTNLVGNALRYTGEGGKIEVATKYADGGILVTVSDTGKGRR